MSDHESVNPADRDGQGEEQQAEDTQGLSRDNDHTSKPGKQAEQNQDMNTQYDPTNGRRPDQRRRNDKQGQMGG